MRKAPQMTGLRALDALIRHGSLSGAARELCVTPAAISHRLRDLHAACGTELVVRRNGRFVPTALGHEVGAVLGDAFQRIRRADALLDASRSAVVHLTAPYSFATLWLAANLPAFEAANPDIDVRILPSHDPLQEAEGDLTVVHSDTRPGADWTELFRDRCGVVGRPSHPFIATPPADLNDILQGPIVHLGLAHGSRLGAFSWKRWGEILGLTASPTDKGAQLTAEHLALDLVLRKDVLGLISVINAADRIDSGAIGVIPGTIVPSECSYWIRISAGAARSSANARALLGWLSDALSATRVTDP